MFIIQRLIFHLIVALTKLRGFFYSFFLKSCGTNFRIDRGVRLGGLHNLSVGKDIWFGRNCEVNASGGVTIEDNVLISPNVKIYSSNHDYRDMSKAIMFGGSIKKPVLIQKGSWLCVGCIILPGVRVGQHSVVAAGAVVTKDVPDFTLVTGNPATIKKYLK